MTEDLWDETPIVVKILYGLVVLAGYVIVFGGVGHLAMSCHEANARAVERLEYKRSRCNRFYDAAVAGITPKENFENYELCMQQARRKGS